MYGSSYYSGGGSYGGYSGSGYYSYSNSGSSYGSFGTGYYGTYYSGGYTMVSAYTYTSHYSTITSSYSYFIG